MKDWRVCDTSVVGFPSVPHEERVGCDVASQCSRPQTATSSCQTSLSVNQQTQCDDVATDFTTDIQQRQQQETITPSLVAFVARTCRIMEQELIKSRHSRALDQLLIRDEDDEQEMTATLSCFGVATADFMVSSVSWNCTGTLLAVGHSHKCGHTDWCIHQSYVAVYKWHSGQHGAHTPSAPPVGGAAAVTRLDTDCCVTCTSFHHSQPHLLLLGLFSGDILVCSTLNTNPGGGGGGGEWLICNSQCAPLGHREPVCQLVWRRSSDTHQLQLSDSQLLSASSDGRLLLWTFSARRRRLKLLKQFRVSTEQRLHNNNNNNTTTAESFLQQVDKEGVGGCLPVGVTCLAPDPADDERLLVGTQAGDVLLANLSSQIFAPTYDGGNCGEDVLDPVVVRFAAHLCHTLALNWHHTRRTVFVSVAVDNQVRVYSTLQMQPVAVVHIGANLVAATMLPSTERWLVAAADGRMLLVSPERQDSGGCGEITLAGDRNDSAVSCLLSNPLQAQVVACGTSCGCLQMCNVPLDGRI